jgi:tRNA U34 5-methylaminomethyl-2-thiouridine-forming methyltransferase MnmC
LLPWPELAHKAKILVNTAGHIDHPTLKSNVIIGDAIKTLPQWKGRADAWFLDGFSPSKNPTMWQEDLMYAVAAHTAQRGTFATFTSAGFVRQNLSRAGFDAKRIDGHGRKRHMSVGILKD